MKKLFGLLALTVAVSGVATATSLKNIYLNTDVRYQYKDFEKYAKGNEVGHPGFSQKDRARTRFNKTIGGAVVLSEKHGVDLDFSLLHRNQTTRVGVNRTAEGVFLKPFVKLSKDVQVGNLDTKWELLWFNESFKKTQGYVNGVPVDTDKVKTSDWNEFAVGPKFKVGPVNVDTKLVYYNVSKGGSGEHFVSAAATTKPTQRVDGYGFNLGLSHGGNFYKGDYGTVSYGLGFDHKFRTLNAKWDYNGGESVPSTVKVSWTQNVRYTTPSFRGFTAALALENEWYRQTAVSGWTNEFYLPLYLNYTTSVDTSVGKVTVAPWFSHALISRVTTYDKHDTLNKRNTTENTELRFGLNLKLDLAK